MPDGRRDRLRGELARLRAHSGLSGRKLVELMEPHGVHTTQATISRVESGATMPSLPLVKAWVAITSNSAAERDRLMDLAEAVHAETRGWAELLGDGGHTQREMLRRETGIAEAWNYQNMILPGLLQTADYARAVFRLGRTRNVEEAVTVRLERQQRLQEQDRRFRFLIAEQVLASPVGSPEVLAGQLARLASRAVLPSVELAILPAGRVVALALNNFVIWVPRETGEPRFVTAELVDGEHLVSDPKMVELYAEVWARLWGAAVTGDDAIALIRGLGGGA